MCEVVVLFDGYSERLDEETARANCSCCLVKGPKIIVVDTMTAWDRDKLIEALNRQNVKPSDVDYVVCSHGHSDHIGNNNLFLNAEHIVGHCIHRGDKFYEKNLKNEDYQLCEGVKITATPGHTAEDISVLVEAIIDGEKKCVAITGDLFEKEEDVLDPSIWQEMGAPELRATQSIMRSRIANIADFIVPGHGPMFAVTDDMRKQLETQKI